MQIYRLFRLFALLIALPFTSMAALAATYTLPNDAGSGPFSNCTVAGSTMDCTGAPTLANGDIIVLQSDLLWNNTASLTIANNSVINQDGLYALTIHSNGAISVNNGAAIWANLDAAGSMAVNQNINLYGNADAAGPLSIGSNSTITGVCTQNFGTAVNSCLGSQEIAYFALDDATWSNGNASLVNLRTGSLQATPLGSSSQVTGYRCKGASVPFNTSDTPQDGIDTNVDVDDDIGNIGTIAFWVNSNEDWGTGERVLLDASQSTSVASPKYFELRITNSGQLLFSLEDNLDADYTVTSSFNSGNLPTAGTWTHVAIGWNVNTRDLWIQLNGQRNTFNNELNNNRLIGELETLHIGDNRSNYHGNGNSANAIFDEVRIFADDLTTAEVQAVANHTQPECTVNIPAPVVEYRFDELSWNGTAGEVTDSSANGLNATADTTSNTTTSNDAVLCEAASFNGSNQFITAPDLSTLESTATLSFWIKTPAGYSGNNTNWSAPGITGIEISGATTDIFWGWIDNSGHIGISQGDGTSGQSTSTINDNNYHHIALTRNASTGWVQVYVDGSLEHEIQDTTLSITQAFYDIGVVRRSNGSSPTFLNALVDELVVFDQVLSATQISEIQSLQSSGKNLDGTDRNCVVAPGTLTPLAWFSLDEIASGQYADNTSNGYSIDTTGSATHVDPTQGKVCSANLIGDNNTEAEIDGLLTDLQLGPGNDVGDNGAISFWFNSTSNWNGQGRSRILWDASSTNRYFNLHLTANGALEFAFQDNNGGNSFVFSTSNFTYSANSWHHISLSWNLPSRSVTFYIDGASVTSTFTSGNWNNYDTLPSLNYLLFGDARNSDTRNGIDQSANGRFDEVYVFDNALTASEALAVYNASHPCPILPIAYYALEEAVWTGAADEVKDETANGLDLTNSNNDVNLTAGRLCTGAFFNGAQGYLTRANDSVLDDYSAGVSTTFWVNPTAYPASGDSSILVSKPNHLVLRLTNAGRLQLLYRDASSASQVQTINNTPLNLNAWYHISVALSPTSEKIWIDGNLVHDVTHSHGLRASSNSIFKIGASNNAGLRQFSGRIDEVRWYNQPITQSEVTRDLLATHSCDTSLIGWYQLEEANYSGLTGEIIDYSGNRNNGFSEGATPRATGYQCYGATIPQNNSRNVYEGIQTGVDMDADLGDQGTIMLWYNSASGWASGRERTLIDASTDYAGSANDKYFYLSIQADGRLNMEFEDAVDDNDFVVVEPTTTARTAGQWYHIAITWDYTVVDESANTGFQIFVDGVLVANNIRAVNSPFINGMPNYQRVHFGDNASSYSVVPGASADGTVDEMQLYNRMLSAAEIVNASSATHPCAGAAIVRYQFDESSWNGTPDEVTDSSGFSYNALAIGSVSPNLYTSVCRAAQFDHDDASPTNINAIATPIDIDRDIGNEGSIMMWVRSERDWGSFTYERNLFDASRNPREFYASALPGGEVQFVLTDASNNRFVLTTAALGFTANDWVHLAFTWNFTSQQMNIYVNGTLAASTPGAGVFNIADLPNLYLGDSQNSRSNGTDNSWYGWMEDTRIYNYERTNGEVNNDIADYSPCVELLDHFDVDEYDNADSTATTAQAINCTPEAVRIQARLANNTTDTGFTGTVRLEARNTATNTLTGAWAYTGSNSFTLLGTGLADLSFIAGDNGVIGDNGELTLSVTDPSNVTVQVNYGIVSETSGNANAGSDPIFVFAQSGFIVTDTVNGAAVASVDMIAGTDSATLYLKAITSDPTTGVCTGLFNNNVAVEMGTSCVNPNSCAAGEQIGFIQGGTTNLPNPENNSGSPTTDITTVFGADSTAQFRINSPDVGEHQHTFTYRLNGPTSTAGETLSTSVRYFARPDSIAITSRRNSAGGELDPALTNTVMAGEDFYLTISGLNAANQPYASFNRIDYDTATIALDHYPIAWTDALLTPVSGQPGTLSGGNSWSASGQSLDTPMRYSEISSIRLSGLLSDFWNGGSGVYNYSLGPVDIATLVPSHLNLVSQTTANWNSSLADVYQGLTTNISGFSVDLRALNAENLPLQNWDNTSPAFNSASNALQKLSSYNSVGGALASDLSWTVNNPVDDDIVTLTADFSNVIWTQNLLGPNANDLPVNVTGFELPLAAMTDSTGLCIETVSGAGCSSSTTTVDTSDRVLYLARMSLPDQVNGTDSQVDIPLTFETLSAFTSGEPIFTRHSNEDQMGLVAGEINGLDHLGSTCTLTGGCPAVGALSPISLYNLTDADPELAGGTGYLQYTLPTASDGILDASLNLPSWLHWDWDNDGTEEAPSTVLLFGSYQGKAPILFTRPGFR